MKKIFVPTDFSDCSKNAIKAASTIARKTGAEVFLFHSLDTPADWVKLSVEQENKYPETKAKIQAAKEQLKALAASDILAGVTSHWEIQYNVSLVEVIESNAVEDTDLIVMGTHGTSTLTRMLLGSNTQKVVRLSQCPVLTINEHFEGFDIKNIVVASSFEENEVLGHSQKLVAEIAQAFGAEIHLLKVEGVIPSQDIFQAGVWEDLAKDLKVTKASINIDPFATVDEGIVKYATETEADLIFVISHSRKGLARFIMGSVTETVVNFSPIPVMVDHKHNLLGAEKAIAKVEAITAKGLSSIR